MTSRSCPAQPLSKSVISRAATTLDAHEWRRHGRRNQPVVYDETVSCRSTTAHASP